MMKWLKKFSWSIVFGSALAGTMHVSWSKEIGPADDYCREINDPSSGPEIVLAPGDYKGGCKIRRGGTAGAPLIIRALNFEDRPRLNYKEKSGNVLEIYAAHISIRGIDFGPTQSDVDGIRIFAGDDIAIEECVFDRQGGIAIVANHASIAGVTIRRNKIINSSSTAMYFGCHDGEACVVSRLLIEKNFINGVTARPSEIGYGIQIKLNSFGVIRDNVIFNTKGPGIMIYGSRGLSGQSLIERNFVAGSEESSGIVIGGGPAIVRNNVAVNNSEAGISLEDYRQRGLLRKIIVTYNTLYDNRRGGVLTGREGRLTAKIAGNAAASRNESPLFPGKQEGLEIFGNQSCQIDGCFVDPAYNDFTPRSGSPLLLTESGNLPSSPPDDYFGHPRGSSRVIGAIEPPGGIIKMEIKR